jgi:hypothetical protein
LLVYFNKEYKFSTLREALINPTRKYKGKWFKIAVREHRGDVK